MMGKFSPGAEVQGASSEMRNSYVNGPHPPSEAAVAVTSAVGLPNVLPGATDVTMGAEGKPQNRNSTDPELPAGLRVWAWPP